MTQKPKATKICIGDKVLLDDKKSGFVRFIGPIPKKKETQYGIELEQQGSGTTAGTFNKKRYFKCKSKTGIFVSKSKITKSKKSDKSTGPRVTVGNKVTVVSKKMKGTIRYIGKTDINDNLLYGIELESAKGEHNGSVNDRKYFQCNSKCGIFVEASDIKSLVKKTTTNSSGSKKKTPTKTTGSKKKVLPKKTTTKTKTKTATKNTGSKKKTGGKNVKVPKKTTGVKKTGGKKTTTTKTTGNKKVSSKPSPKKQPVKKKEVEYKVTDKVEIKPGKKGQIKYIGEAKNLGPGIWYGVRFTEKRGTCDGYSKGHEFFKCEDGYGVYVQKRLVVGLLKTDNDFDFMNEENEINAKKQEYLDKIKENEDKLQAVHDKFREIDSDNSHSLDREEFSEFAHQVLGCDHRAARDLFDVVDVSKNNQVSFAEFDNWLQTSGLIKKIVENNNNDDNKEEEQNQEETTQNDNEENEDENKENENNENENNEEETQDNTDEQNDENNEEEQNDNNQEEEEEEQVQEDNNDENEQEEQQEQDNEEQVQENNDNEEEENTEEENNEEENNEEENNEEENNEEENNDEENNDEENNDEECGDDNDNNDDGGDDQNEE